MRFKFSAIIGVLLIASVASTGWSQTPKFVSRPTEDEFHLYGLNGPVDVEVDSDGMIYVSEATAFQVRIFRPDGTPELTFGHRVKKYSEDDPTGFVGFKGIGLDKDNNIYVAEKKGGRVRVFNSFGEPLLTMTLPKYLAVIYDDAGNPIYNVLEPVEKQKLPGKKRYDPGAPVDVAVSANGNIYVGDGGGERICVFDYEGNLLTTFDFVRVNNIMTHIRTPNNIAFSSKGELFIAEALPCYIVVTDAKGNYLRYFGKPGNIVGSFQRLTGMTIDDLDRVYAADFVIGSVQVFDDQGNFLHVLTGKGGEQWKVGNLMGLAVDPKRIYLSEALSNQVAVRKFVK